MNKNEFSRTIQFARANALGNSFLLAKTDLIFKPEAVIKLGHPHLGILFDQFIVINSKNEVTVFNTDGSISPTCFNGARSLGAWFNQDILKVKSGVGDITLKRLEKIDYNTYIMQLELHNNISIKKIAENAFITEFNKHKVYITDKEPENFVETYQDMEYNISCIWKEYQGEAAIWKTRTCEVGINVDGTSNETLACGSAAFVIAHILDDLSEKKLDVQFQLGIISHKKEQNRIIQVGPSTIFATGEMEIPANYVFGVNANAAAYNKLAFTSC